MEYNNQKTWVLKRTLSFIMIALYFYHGIPSSIPGYVWFAAVNERIRLGYDHDDRVGSLNES